MLGRVHRFFAFLFAPALGFMVAFAQAAPADKLPLNSLTLVAKASSEQTAALENRLAETRKVLEETEEAIAQIQGKAAEEKQEYEEQNKKIHELLADSQSQTKKSADVLDTILSNLLGDPVGQTFGPNANVKVYSLEESGYRGYMAKVRLKNPRALKMVLANDSIRGKGETTSHAGKRTGAVLAINAGGFMKGKNGLLSPIGITVVDGKIRTFSNDQRISFVGFNNKGRLVGGKITSQDQINQMGILQGASFLPTLLKDGKRMPIPRDWAQTKQPRTLIGHFDNGDLLLIVIDGRRKGWSSGVTLEEAQRKLQEFHVVDAYNLDGGGSSAFYYKGRILNRPSDGRERPVVSNIVIMP
ncbi:phosphodiester glycosidase family protein [Brevibacillus sp. H7]|uniref:phosphodiester glycosidase family protein n=1 Tax=Brevibacillus sp. H7 TaxID=3349138 RepID=UPI0038052D5D